MPGRATATVRELRNEFPKVKRLVEEQGEVVVTDQGAARYRLTLYTPEAEKKKPRKKDYLARLRRHQTRALSAAQARALHAENRGSR